MNAPFIPPATWYLHSNRSGFDLGSFTLTFAVVPTGTSLSMCWPAIVRLCRWVPTFRRTTVRVDPGVATTQLGEKKALASSLNVSVTDAPLTVATPLSVNGGRIPARSPHSSSVGEGLADAVVSAGCWGEDASAAGVAPELHETNNGATSAAATHHRKTRGRIPISPFSCPRIVSVSGLPSQGRGAGSSVFPRVTAHASRPLCSWMVFPPSTTRTWPVT